jgi:hypothetical protein
MKDETVNKLDLFQYTFYDESGNLVVVLDQEFIKKLFNADVILLEETYKKE